MACGRLLGMATRQRAVQLQIDGIQIDLQRKAVKNINFRIRPPDGRVSVSAPVRMSESAVVAAIHSRLDWIRRHQQRLRSLPRPEPLAATGTGLADLKDRMQQDVSQLLKTWEPIIGRKVAAVQIRRMKTLWGSCSVHSGRIRLNLELARRSPACLEYVLVHEMVHLHERYHNKRFYSLMDRFLPDWRRQRDELKRVPPA